MEATEELRALLAIVKGPPGGWRTKLSAEALHCNCNDIALLVVI